MNPTERELMERDRDYAAMGELTPDAMRDIAGRAMLRAYGIYRLDPEKAWEFAQFAADMLRASLPERSEEGDIHCDCGKPKFRDAVACDKCLGKKSSLPEREVVAE